MNRKSLVYLLLASVVFCLLVGYNYLVAQKKIRETRPSPLGINLVTYPEIVVSGESGAFSWKVNSSPDLSTPRTTIYWGYIASPSALTQKDSPEAVAYQHHQDDYYTGLYKLPDTFDLNINFSQAGKVYFRAYAKVGDNHLWTEERYIQIIPKK